MACTCTYDCEGDCEHCLKLDPYDACPHEGRDSENKSKPSA